MEKLEHPPTLASAAMRTHKPQAQKAMTEAMMPRFLKMISLLMTDQLRTVVQQSVANFVTMVSETNQPTLSYSISFSCSTPLIPYIDIEYIAKGRFKLRQNGAGPKP